MSEYIVYIHDGRVSVTSDISMGYKSTVRIRELPDERHPVPDFLLAD